MKFLDKIKDLFSDEEEIIETKEIEIEEEEKKEEHKLPTFMRNKIEEEQRIEEERRQRENPIINEKINVSNTSNMTSDREIIRTRSGNNFSFPVEMDEPKQEPVIQRQPYSNQNVLAKEKKVSELYTKKEEPKPKKFKPTPVISPVYGVLDKNYTKDEVKVSDEKSYEIQRASRKVDFETVRNKAYGSLTDDIRNNLCEKCELYQEVKITKASKIKEDREEDLLADIKEDVTLGTAEENYFDFGVDYEIPTREDTSSVKITRTKMAEEIKIVNHNDEESTAEKIEVKETQEETMPARNKKVEEKLEDTKEFEKISSDEETADSILEGLTDINEESSPENDIFNLIDSMYDEEEK